MKEEMKKHLKTLVESMVNEDSKAADEAFHKYISAKTREMLSEKDDEKEKDINVKVDVEDNDTSEEDESSDEDKEEMDDEE